MNEPDDEFMVARVALLAERDRLKALNAELVEALEAIVNNDFDVLGEPTTAYQEVVRIARAALAKARE